MLATLPSGGAFYAAVHPDVLAKFGELAELEHALLGPGLSLRRLFDSAGGDPRRALLFALIPPSEANARAVLETFVKNGSGKALDAAQKRLAEAILIRVIVPLPQGVDSARSTRTLLEELSDGKAVVCAETAQCKAAFKADMPLVVGRARDRVLAGYPTTNGVRIDLISPLWSSGYESALDTLGRFASLSGGPEPPRCQAFDASAGAALCVDADRAGELGAAIGYQKTLSAVATAGLKTRDAQRIAEQGLKEAHQNMALAAPSRRLLDDGTLRVDSSELGFEFLASWALTPVSKDALERAFVTTDEAQRCADGSEVIVRLLPEIAGAFGDAGPDFSDSTRTLHSVQEAGWGAWPVLFARTWPNALISARERLKEIPPAPRGRTCVRSRNGRLEIETTTEAR